MKKGAEIALIGTGVLATIGIVVLINRSMVKKTVAAVKGCITGNTNITGTPSDVSGASALDPTYYKKQGYAEYGGVLLDKNGTSVLLRSTADKWAQNLQDDYHFLTLNNQSDMISSVTGMNKIKLSYVSDVFLQKFGIKLGDFFVKHMSDAYLTTLQSVINGMS